MTALLVTWLALTAAAVAVALVVGYCHGYAHGRESELGGLDDT